MFSSRLNWDLRPNPLSLLLDQKRRAGARILDLTESNPTRAGFAYPVDEITAALADPAALRYDPSPRGLLSAREAVASYSNVDVSRILLTASTSEAYAYLFKLLADPGDNVLAPRPSYPLFDFLAALESVEIRHYSLRYDGAWHIDFDSLERAITPRTRAIVVVNPNNPTGSFLKRDEWQRLDALAAARGIAILSDEVFAGYSFAPDPFRITGSEALRFSMSGLSKIAGLPQMKLGWIIASSAAALEPLELIADTYLSVSTPVQLALPRLLAAGTSVRAQILERTRANLATLRELTGSESPCRVLNVEGGWSAVIQVPRTRTEEEWTLGLLADHNVLVQPGFFFDFESEAYLVVSLLTRADVFAEGAEVLVRWVVGSG